MTKLCCKPSERDDDRTHTVRYTQISYDDGKVEWEDSGTLDTCCSHNDAVEVANMYAQSNRWHTGLKPRGSNGHWMGSEVLEGDGVKEEVFVYRGPAEEDYDASRADTSELCSNGVRLQS